ncbi:acetylornithine deacetylase [Bradyrhizobium sp. BRP22]|uniref:acetylornithine deacetylase n=1 Tax=Bradyrhizobium sp. BRP22 TaxID=2793821 RepID=UPI001CD6B6C7|nr:acetylornithine deacetylase [Bradyrhizobium sp. BRP22]MCA1453001.1 acetylornithine deacetylase [Bradyrhizobium sp. BRP22]
MVERVAEILSELIRIESISANSNLDLVAYIERILASSGVSARRVPAPDGHKASLLATIGPSDRSGVVLSAHTDVVPVDGQAWTVPPFGGVTRDGRIYGRGATDMKGFLAVVLAAVPQFVETAQAAPVHLAFSYDEEVGCRGAPDLVQALMPSVAPPALAIVGEPTCMRVVRAHKGKVARRLIVTGRTGHSAMPHRAANAVDAAVAIGHALRALADEEIARGGDTAFDPPFTTIHVGSLHGGSAVNLVPERAVLEYEIRTIPGRDAGEILARIDALVACVRDRLRACAAEADIVSEEMSAYPGLDTSLDDAATRLVARLANDKQPATTVAFGTEAGLFDQAGIPTLVCGPGDMARGHKADEWIGFDELAAASAMMNRLADLLHEPSEVWMQEPEKMENSA